MSRLVLIIVIGAIALIVFAAGALGAPEWPRGPESDGSVAAVANRVSQVEQLLQVEEPITAWATGQKVTKLRVLLAPAVVPIYEGLRLGQATFEVAYQSKTQGHTSVAWSANWLIGGGPSLDPGERVELVLELPETISIGPRDSFTITLEPAVGPALVLHLKLPSELAVVNYLRL